MIETIDYSHILKLTTSMKESEIFLYIYDSIQPEKLEHAIMVNFTNLSKLQTLLNYNPKFVLLNLKEENYLILICIESFKYFTVYKFVNECPLVYLLNENFKIDFSSKLIYKNLSQNCYADICIYTLSYIHKITRNNNFLEELKNLSTNYRLIHFIKFLNKYKEFFNQPFLQFEISTSLSQNKSEIEKFIFYGLDTLYKMILYENIELQDFYKTSYTFDFYKININNLFHYLSVLKSNYSIFKLIKNILLQKNYEKNIKINKKIVKKYIIYRKNDDILKIFYNFNLL